MLQEPAARQELETFCLLEEPALVLLETLSTWQVPEEYVVRGGVCKVLGWNRGKEFMHRQDISVLLIFLQSTSEKTWAEK